MPLSSNARGMPDADGSAFSRTCGTVAVSTKHSAYLALSDLPPVECETAGGAHDGVRCANHVSTWRASSAVSVVTRTSGRASRS